MINKTILSLTLGSFTLMTSGAGAIESADTILTSENPVRASQPPIRSDGSASTASNTRSTTAGSTYITPRTGGNAASSGRTAQNVQMIGSMVGIGAGVMYMRICPSTWGTWACPLAAAALVGAASLNSASGGSGAAGSAMSAYDPSMYGSIGSQQPVVDQWGNAISPGATGSQANNAGGADTPIGMNVGAGGRLPDGTTSVTIARDIANLRSSLEKSGAVISADGRTMTTKDGRKFDLTKGADGSMEGLMAMGLTAAEAQKAAEAGSKYAAAANAKYGAMLAKMNADGGGGGGLASLGPAADGSGGSGGGGYSWNDPRNKPRAKAKVAGLTRKLGDDTIGVAGDDIFEMVTRRYKARDENGNFLKD